MSSLCFAYFYSLGQHACPVSALFTFTNLANMLLDMKKIDTAHDAPRRP